MPDAPDWATFLGERYDEFRGVVVAELKGRALAFDPAHLDCGVIYTPASGTFGLANVARLCHGAARDAWPAIVAEHLQRCLARAVDLDFEVAAPRLRVRIVPDRQVEAQAGKLVIRPLARGLVLALAIDKPEHVVFVSPKDLERWQRTFDELFDLADTHTRAEPALDRHDLEVEGSPTIAVLLGPSYYAATHVTFVDRYVAAGAHGHLVAVPDRHAVIAAAFDGAASLGALGPLVRLAHARFAEEPGAITDQLYWRRLDGALVKIACGVNADGAPWVAPPEDFNAVVT